MIERRALLRTLGLGLLAVPLGAEAQPARRIGFLGGASAAGYEPLVEAFVLGLRDHGYVPGKNVTIEYRWADGAYERLPALAAELVRLKVDLIVTQGTPAAFAAKGATSTIPIVMAIVGNPVESGVVASYSRPGGNVTGSSFFWGDLNAKRLEFLKTLNPRLTHAAVLINPDNLAMAELLRAMEERAQALKVSLLPLNVRRLDEFAAALQLAKKQAEALTVPEDGVFQANAGRLADLAGRNRLPSIGFRAYCEAGGLLAYAVDFPHIWRQGAMLVDKIFKGAKPADLPIQQATRFELVINLRTARALGLTFPPELLARADQVIHE
ncbi:MAG TPA: ABC transporter substrate-binding protein [Methylomirabilota bacterium]|jgi:putative ABC transport system substrate-binding protein